MTLGFRDYYEDPDALETTTDFFTERVLEADGTEVYLAYVAYDPGVGFSVSTASPGAKWLALTYGPIRHDDSFVALVPPETSPIRDRPLALFRRPLSEHPSGVLCPWSEFNEWHILSSEKRVIKEYIYAEK